MYIFYIIWREQSFKFYEKKKHTHAITQQVKKIKIMGHILKTLNNVLCKARDFCYTSKIRTVLGNIILAKVTISDENIILFKKTTYQVTWQGCKVLSFVIQKSPILNVTIFFFRSDFVSDPYHVVYH